MSVRRVFIMGDHGELMPGLLNFVKGVGCSDLFGLKKNRNDIKASVHAFSSWTMAMSACLVGSTSSRASAAPSISFGQVASQQNPFLPGIEEDLDRDFFGMRKKRSDI